MKVAVNYTIFAILATIANIASQEMSVQLYAGDYAMLISIMVGTGVGLLVKYFLDKKYIFRFQVHSMAHDGQTFVLYTLMGIVTTFVFWGFEFGFDYLFQTRSMRYLGGVIGLAIGYYVKYQLDKRFVFVSQEA